MMVTYLTASGVRVDPFGRPVAEPEATSAPATGPTNDELKAQLDELGVKYPSNANKAKLLELLEATSAPASGADDAS